MNCVLERLCLNVRKVNSKYHVSADEGRPGPGATTEGRGDGAAPPGAADAGDGAGAFVSGGGETDGCATASAAAARAGQSVETCQPSDAVVNVSKPHS